MLNNSTEVKKVIKRKVKETVFKPESNQPTIKNIIIPKLRKDQDQEKQEVQLVQKGQTSLATITDQSSTSMKKRKPPTPPDINQP